MNTIEILKIVGYTLLIWGAVAWALYAAKRTGKGW